MSEEKQRLEGELDEARIEQRALENGRVALEMENRRLLDRVNSMDQHMVSHNTVIVHVHGNKIVAAKLCVLWCDVVVVIFSRPSSRSRAHFKIWSSRKISLLTKKASFILR